MIIYSPTGETLLDVMPDDNSYRHRAMMGDNALTLYFSLAQHVEIPVGAYCEHGGERYTLMRPEALKMQHTRHFDYTLELVAEQGKMSIWKFRNTVDGRLRFSLTAKPHEHLQMLVDNLNRRDSGWTLGACIDSPERVVNYDHAFCRDALAMIAKEFGTEYEIVGKRISLGAVEHDRANALPLSYGKGNGFVSGVARTNSEDSVPTEILYVQGGERNIDRSKYGASTLHLPVNAAIAYDGAHFEGEAGYDAAHARRYRTDEKGFAVQRADRPLSSKAEDSVDLTDIYPSRVGTVGEVITANEKNHFYDFTDPTIPDTLDFEKCLIAGEKMTVIFQSGMLSGREFEVKYAHAASGKKPRRFEIVPQEIDGMTMPGGMFVPRSGDKYAVFHCMLPQAYINDTATRSGAEWDLLRKAVQHLYTHEMVKFAFTGTLDGIWAKRNWANVGGRLKIGAFILFSDKQFQPEGVAVRIVGIKDYINTPHSPEIELSNAPVSSSFGTTLKALESAAVAVEEKHREALQYSKRRFRDAQETAEMIGAALSDRFTNAISPAAVQTMSLLVGDESLQFRFVGSRTNPTAVPHVVTYNAKTKTMNAASGILQHLTLGIRTVSAKHSPSEYRFWDVAAFTSGRLDDASKKYYLYVRAPRNGNRAEFVPKESPVGFESDAANYHLLVGVLNSEYDGDRSFAPLYGFSEVLPGRITTDRVATSDGRSFFDLAAGEMRLGDSLVYQNGRLSLRGTLVQNEGGVTSPLACYRGEWNATTTYYNGDEVRHTDAEGVVSTYRYIGERSSSGAPLTDKTKWTISASGVKGKDGSPGYDGKSAPPTNPNLLNFTAKWRDKEGNIPYQTEDSRKSGANITTPDEGKYGTKCFRVQADPEAAPGNNGIYAFNVGKDLITGTLKAGQWYTYSFYVRGKGYLRSAFYFQLNPVVERRTSVNGLSRDNADYLYQPISDEWRRVVCTFRVESGRIFPWFVSSLSDSQSTDDWMEICCAKFEEGEDATPWCLSENDKIGAAGIDGESYHVNLIDNSSFAKGLEGWEGGYGMPTFDDSMQIPVPGTRVVKFTGDGVGALPFHEAKQNVRQKLLPDTTYTYSVWAKTSQTMRNARIIVYPAPYIEQQIDYEHGGEWTRHAITFTTGRNLESEQYVYLRLCTQTDPNATVWFAAPKLEVGDTPTEWTPSENDRKGDPGKSSYTHVAYSNSPDGNPCTLDPKGEKFAYLGTYTDENEAASTNPARYVWAKVQGDKGDNGRGVSRMRAFYMLTTKKDAPQPDTSEWTETAPQPTKERPWLWNYERSEYTDGTADQTAVRLIGHYGKDGTNGTSIRAQYSADARTWHDDFAEGDVWMRTGNGTTWGGALRVVGESGTDGKSPVYDFAASTQLATASGTTAPTIRGTWQDAPPTLREGEVLWYRLTAANGKITYGRLSGEKGKPSYIHMAYANSDDGKKDFTLEEDLGRNSVEDFRYFGIYSDFDERASQKYSDYTWTQLRGADGLAPNTNLLDGTNFESRVPWATFNVSESSFLFNGKPTQFGYSQLAEGQFKDLLVQEITSVLKVGQTYTFSAWMQARGTLTWIFSGVEFAEAPKVNGVQTGNTSGAGNIPENKKSWEYERVTVTFKVKTMTSPRQYFYIRAWGESSLNIVDPKLEVGTIATPWCPTERDLRADYRELRFAVNGSPTQPPAISSDRRTPDGWNIAQPVVGVGQYLWMISATVSRYETALLDRWSTPTRITPEDGKNGRDGEAPAMVYRGVWDASKEYYGTKHRRDAVFHNGAYYIARTDAGTFRGVDPTDKLKWNDFGASFESVATQLLLAEHANVGRWILSNGNLVSDLDDTRTHIRLDARDNELWLHSSYLENKPKAAESALSNIVLKASSGGLGTSTSFVSSDETYHSNTSLSWEGVSSVVEYVPDLSAPLDERSEAISGRMRRADNGIAVGVAGYAENYGKGEAFGGYFVNLKARGLIVGLKRVGEQNNNTTVSLELTDTRVVGLHDNFGNVDVRLPAKASEGQTIVFTQVGRGTMKILPPVGESNHRFGNYSDRILSEYSVNRSKTVRLTLLRNVNIGNERGINLWIVEE
nr:MAG TPA: Minor structural protein 4 [Caudoviricetes sp.]